MKHIVSFLMIILTRFFVELNAQPNVKIKSYDEYAKADQDKNFPEHFTHDPKSKMNYLLANDDKNLYLKILVSDEVVQKKILAFGNNLWINTDGSKKRRLGIQFPVQDTKNMPRPPKDRKDDFSEKKIEIAGKFSTAKLVGMAGKKNETVIDIHSTNDVKLRIYFSQTDKLIQEYEIPFSFISSDFSANALNNLSIGIMTGYLTAQMQPQPESGNSQVPPPDRGRSPEMEEIAVPSELWIKNITINK